VLRECRGSLTLPTNSKDCHTIDGRIPLKANWRWPQIYAFGVVTIILIACGWPARGQNSSQQAKPAQSGNALAVEAGKTFAATCAGCHGLDGRGGERGPNIATRPEVVRRSDAELLQILRDGKTASGMPSFAVLGDSKLAAMVSYLRTLQRKNEAAPISGDVKHGESLFFGKARCAECHSVNGKGGFIGSDLTDYAAGSSATEIKNAIVSPDIDQKEVRSKTLVTLRDGKKWEGIVRNEDNFSLQLQSMDGVFHLIQKAEAAEIKADQPLMPDDYGKSLSAAELDDLVGYLMNVARTNPGAIRRNRRHRHD
jgi:cytochrome c oxidase cbb3-type subunit 3